MTTTAAWASCSSCSTTSASPRTRSSCTARTTGPTGTRWPDADTTPFRSEKNTTWEGAFRVPLLLRWPRQIGAGSVSNEIVSHLDWLPTFLAAAGEPDIKQKLLKGRKVGKRSFKVHLDGYDLLPYLTGQEQKSPRIDVFYFSDDGDLLAFRYDNWKFVFLEQRCQGTLAVWAEPFTQLRVPKIYNLRTDPFEFADITSNTYWDWLIDHAFMLVPAQHLVKQFMATFKAFPPRQRAASFTVQQAHDKLGACGD